jgi:hypothetical protein
MMEPVKLTAHKPDKFPWDEGAQKADGFPWIAMACHAAKAGNLVTFKDALTPCTVPFCYEAVTDTDLAIGDLVEIQPKRVESHETPAPNPNP